MICFYLGLCVGFDRLLLYFWINDVIVYRDELINPARAPIMTSNFHFAHFAEQTSFAFIARKKVLFKA